MYSRQCSCVGLVHTAAVVRPRAIGSVVVEPDTCTYMLLCGLKLCSTLHERYEALSVCEVVKTVGNL